MTPEQLLKDLWDRRKVGIESHEEPYYSFSLDGINQVIAAITQLQKQNQNYKEQITSLVKEKHRRNEE